ncbi:MAG TPA: hypothetical protein VH092_06205, partial [Urbifossiella sp.]|nr:hypothetical protein [Urbifossiella sp.]
QPVCLVTEINRFVTQERAGVVVNNILDLPSGEIRHAFFDTFGLWLEVARAGKDKQDLVVALFGPGARRASLSLVNESWNRAAEHRHVAGGECLGIGGQYVQWEVDKTATAGTALQVWITIGERRYPAVEPDVPPDTGTYRLLDV